MTVLRTELEVKTNGQGLILITDQVNKALATLSTQSAHGFAQLFLMHTSASLLLQENSDPTARADLEDFLNRIAPEGEPWHRHLVEGSDDTVSHLKAAVLPNSLLLPVEQGQLHIGTWQGIYLWEHRRAPHTRRIIISVW
jgi:secondary thiamine-phosphate synthase enzyme